MDGLPIFDTTIDGEHVEFVALSKDAGLNNVLEMLFIRETVELRQLDDEAFVRLWEFLREERARCAPALESLKA